MVLAPEGSCPVCSGLQAAPSRASPHPAPHLPSAPSRLPSASGQRMGPTSRPPRPASPRGRRPAPAPQPRGLPARSSPSPLTAAARRTPVAHSRGGAAGFHPSAARHPPDHVGEDGELEGAVDEPHFAAADQDDARGVVLEEEAAQSPARRHGGGAEGFPPPASRSHSAPSSPESAPAPPGLGPGPRRRRRRRRLPEGSPQAVFGWAKGFRRRPEPFGAARG